MFHQSTLSEIPGARGISSTMPADIVLAVSGWSLRLPCEIVCCCCVPNTALAGTPSRAHSAATAGGGGPNAWSHGSGMNGKSSVLAWNSSVTDGARNELDQL